VKRRRSGTVASNPVLIGAVTTLVVVVAVFLAYNANKGLPFVPTFELKVETPDAARLVVGNDVREGGFRIGQVSAIDTVRKAGGTSGAELTLKLDKVAAPVPADSTVLIRPRSALGLKYVEFVRGKSARELPEGAVVTATRGAIGPELDDFFDVFDERTRKNVDRNLAYFGAGLAARGPSLNRTLAALPELLGDLPPVMSTLSAPDTQLVRFFSELEDAARVARPLSGTFARGFTAGADTFEAFSRDPQALRDTISRSPATLDEGIRSLPASRPFLARLAAISGEVRTSSRALRASLPAVNRALAAGTPVLRRTPPLNEDLRTALRATRRLADSPTTDVTLDGLTSTMGTLTPTLRYLGPHVTVCNYFTYFFTFLSDHLSEEEGTGTLQRIQVKNAPPLQPHSMASFGAPLPANGEPIDPVQHAVFGDSANLHSQPYGRAVNAQGAADCESGQRGYLPRLAEKLPANFNVVVDPRTPGDQGPTFKGRPRVPAGQTFTAEPGGIAPQVVDP
jgi:virulence factor Mce-like protein